MHAKINNKIRDIKIDIQKVEDKKLKHHLRSELAVLEGMIHHGIKREFSYIKSVSLTIAGATGVILFWRGIYELSKQTAFLESPHLSLVTGLVILGLTGLLSKEFITVPARKEIRESSIITDR